MGTPSYMFFCPFCKGEKLLWHPACFPGQCSPLKKRPSLQGKNLLLWEQILFFKRLTVNEMRGKHENKRVTSPGSVHVHLKMNSAQLSDQTAGPGCSKLTTLLVNGTLKFPTLISQICQYFFNEKMWEAFAVQKLLSFFQQKISVYLVIKS